MGRITDPKSMKCGRRLAGINLSLINKDNRYEQMIKKLTKVYKVNDEF